jgi:hypothetical protein
VTAVHTFATIDEQAVAMHGLWIACAASRAPAVCPSSDSSMLFGTMGGGDPSSRVVACGHVTSHGDGFIANPDFSFTYDVKRIDSGGTATPSYELHLSNATTDRHFALSYRDDTATAGSLINGTITLGEPGGVVGSLQHSAFTTF